MAQPATSLGDPTLNPAEMGLSVIVPCYNEEKAIAPVLDRLDAVLREAGLAHEIIVVDDGSTDATAERIDTARFHLIRHDVNTGYGAALKTGAAQARFPLLAITDADGTYPNEELPRLVRELGAAEMVVGARTGQHVHVPLARRPAKWALTRLANYLTGQHIPDLNSGLRVIRRELWDRFSYLFPDGFSLTTTITLASLTNHRRVKYVPINYHARVGSSKIRPIRHTIEFIQLILRTVLYFQPLKVFVPVSLSLFLASVLIGAGTLILSNVFHIGKFMDVTTVLLFLSALQLIAIGALADLITKRMR
jgi:glycosyltransferase involved in cell wall biosynthesis